MSPALLKSLEEQTHAPRGIAARIDSQDLRQLLEERAAFLGFVRRMERRLPFYAAFVDVLRFARELLRRADAP